MQVSSKLRKVQISPERTLPLRALSRLVWLT